MKRVFKSPSSPSVASSAAQSSVELWTLPWAGKSNLLPQPHVCMKEQISRWVGMTPPGWKSCLFNAVNVGRGSLQTHRVITQFSRAAGRYKPQCSCSLLFLPPGMLAAHCSADSLLSRGQERLTGSTIQCFSLYNNRLCCKTWILRGVVPLPRSALNTISCLYHFSKYFISNNDLLYYTCCFIIVMLE